MAAQKQDDQLERTFSSYVRIQDVVLKTYLGRWTIGRSGERGSGISVPPARYDDDFLSFPTMKTNVFIKKKFSKKKKKKKKKDTVIDYLSIDMNKLKKDHIYICKIIRSS